MSSIEFDNVRFSYDAQRNALDGVTLCVEQGSFVCVLGGNGSGKSTLAKHINALLVPDEGTVRVMGLDTSAPENVFFVRSNAGMVFQNPDDQIVASVIENDVAFGPENLGVPTAELRTRVASALKQVGLQGFEKKQTEALSGGQKQRVAVAGVLAMNPQILVLDEASAMLDPRGRAGLLRVCRELNDAGLTIVLITHFMEEAACADRVIVLDKGTIALDGTPDDVFLEAERLVELSLDIPFATRLSMALRDEGVPVTLHADEEGLMQDLLDLVPVAGGRFPRPREFAHADEGNVPLPREPRTASVIAFENVSFTYEPISQKRRRASSVAPEGKQADWGRSPDEYWALRNLTFEVEEGEFLGIAGHTGSGKSTLIQLANGLLTPTEGTVRIKGQALSGKKALAEARADIGVVFQYPEHQLFAATVFDDVAFGPRNLGYSSAQVEKSVREAMALVHLDPDELKDRNPFELSGGQQRRVAFAGVLAMHPHTLVLDEPVAGLDPRAKQRFLALLQELHDNQGMTIVVVSHNMDDLATLCDRVLVLNEGQLFALDAPANVFADEQRLKSVGLGVPQASHLANRLAEAGLDIALGTIPTAEELARSVGALYGQREGGR